MSMASITVTVSRNVFATIRRNLEGLMPDVDRKIRFLPSAKVELTVSLPETPENEQALDDFFFMVAAYIRIGKRAERIAEHITNGGLSIQKSVKIGNLPTDYFS